MTAGTAGAAAPTLSPRNPWPGLDPYDEGAQHYFHGRDDEAERLARLIAAHPVVSLYGKSGLGKSSLLQAGVFPRLRTRRFLPVYARLDFSPGAPSPWLQLARRLCAAADDAKLDRPAFDESDGLWRYLHRTDFALWTPDNFPVQPVLVLDQFEELFSRAGRSDGELGPLLDALGDLAENRIPPEVAADRASSQGLDLIAMRYRLVLSFREDFMPELRAREARLPSLMRHALRLLPMSRDQAIEAVATAGEAVLAPGTAPAIVDFVAGLQDETRAVDRATVEPVLLSLCCTQMNKRRPPAGRIDATLVSQTGQDILESFYAEAMAGMPESVHRFVEDHLVQGRRTRGSYGRQEALDSRLVTGQQLDQLVNVYRVLRIDDQGGAARIELIHDRLVEVVRRARDARAARVADEEARRALDAAQRTKAQRGRIAALATALGVVTALLALAYQQNIRKSAAERQALAAAEAASRAAASASAAAAAAELRLAQLTRLSKYSNSDAVDADNAVRAALQRSTPEDKARRAGVALQIWAKDIDSTQVRASLEPLGFRLETERAKLKSDATNTVWFGTATSAHFEDVQLVALGLMRAGIGVRGLRPITATIATRDDALIQVGTSAHVLDCPAMTVQQVLAVTAAEVAAPARVCGAPGQPQAAPPAAHRTGTPVAYRR